FLRALYLPNNSFQGTIPRELGRLSRLRRLHLGANKFSEVIPANLSRCSNLEVLSLAQNNLVGSIPKEMSLLSKLTGLVINDNKLTGGIPPFLGNITSMEIFSATGNPLGGSIPDTLGHWKSLTVFHSGSCNLNGSIPHSIFNLSLLVNISLPDNELSGSLPSELGNQLPNLELLQLWGNKLTRVLPPSISNCSKLVILDMAENNFSGKLTIDFSKLRDIYKIHLPNNNFHGRGEAGDMSLLGLGDNQLSGSLPSSIGSLVGLTTIGRLQKLQLLGRYSYQFSGSIPEAIRNLSLLTYLDLSYNKLEGNIPSSLGKCKNLNVLILVDNRLSGKIPRQLLQLPSLTISLDLSQNKLSGTIPSEIKDLKMLSRLDLSYNKLSGTITSSVGECISLTMLNPRGNLFHGIIPYSLSSLRGLEVLDISQNNLSGEIPQFFDKRFSLTFLNLSFNDFEGEVRVVGAFSNTNAFSVLGNNRLCGGLVTLELPTCKEKGTKKEVFHFFVLLIFIAPSLLVVLFFSSIHKGILASDDDRFVAVKVLRLQIRGAHKSFLAKYEAWRNIRHRNLLKIVTSCSSVDFQGNDFKAIVYEFMPSGSVHDWLHSSANTSKLNLLQRINILRYFGLARLLGTDLNQNKSSRFKGTIGYAPPEYGMGSEMASSGDVYSFGILLLEVMTGKKPTYDMFNDGLSLHKFAYMALPDHVINVIDEDAIVLQSTKANAKKVEECLVATIKIGVSCSVDSPPQRMKSLSLFYSVFSMCFKIYKVLCLIPSLLGEVESKCNKERFMSLLNKRYVVKHTYTL
ncbi:kinase-like domain-containing protein, partial [Tanacetum coccineum]